MVPAVEAALIFYTFFYIQARLSVLINAAVLLTKFFV